MEQAYQCQICNKKFPMFLPYGGRIPQRNNLKQNASLTVHNLLVKQLPVRCFKCDEKIMEKISKVINKDRRRIDLSEKAYNKDLTGNPLEEHADWKKRKMIEYSSGKFKCSACQKGFDDIKHVFSRTVRIKVGMYGVGVMTNMCMECINDIVQDLRRVLK